MRRELVVALVYFAGYVAYLGVHLETERGHWLSLVAIPLALMAWAGRHRSVSEVCASVGLGRDAVKRGWVLAALLAVAFQALQLMNARQAAALSARLAQPHGWLLLPAALILVLLTAATTEEVFFRGVLQTRLADRFGALAGWLLSTVAFAIYHVPYRYLVPGHPSSGHFGAAVAAAVADGGFGGLVLGGVFWRSRGNLLAAIVVHAAIDLLPAAAIVRW